jgi:hypothetical protein
VLRSFATSVAELEGRVADAEREADQLAERLQKCNARRSVLNQLIDNLLRWAAEQTPPTILPGDGGASCCRPASWGHGRCTPPARRPAPTTS